MVRNRTDHAQLVDELHTQLTARFAEMTTSTEWIDYLSTARKFHRYSPQNQLLLALQGAEGHVAGYRNWQRIPAVGGGTCQVAKGAVGLKILAPMTAKTVEVDEATGEETTRHRLRGFRTVNVFHQGQLVAPPDLGDAVLPELLTGENRWQHVWTAVSDRLTVDGFDIKLHTRSPIEQWNGMTTWSERTIKVAGDLEPPQRLKTLLHEWAHVELGHETRTGVPGLVKEVEAESVAYLLAQTVGLDSDAYSVPYIAGWSDGDIDVVHSAAEQILTTTKRLVTTLEHELGIDLTPDALDHALPESNVIAMSTAANERSVDTPVDTPQPAGAVQEAFDLGDAYRPAEPSPPTPDTDHRFLKAVMDDLEPDQKNQLIEAAFDPSLAARAAAIISTAGRNAGQTARILHSVSFDPETIRDALLSKVDGDPERTTLYTAEQTRAALLQLDTDLDIDALMPATTDRERTLAQLHSDRNDDLELVRRAIQTGAEAARVAALAYGLDISPEQTIKLCAALDAQPQRTMAIAIALREGDGPAAFNDLVETWPDVPGGWERHAHPSMRARPKLTVVPDYDPTRVILDRWAGRGPQAPAPTPSPAPSPALP